MQEACSVLGVAEDADADAIAAAFKALAMKWHPDRNKDNVEEATARFAELSAARDLLLDRRRSCCCPTRRRPRPPRPRRRTRSEPRCARTTNPPT